MSASFDEYPQPEWNTASSITNAIDAAASAVNQQESNAAYDQLLDALGNNHAGTYYPVVLAVLPHIGAVLNGKNPWAQSAALNVLIELTGSFSPEPGHENHAGAPLALSLQSSVEGMSASIQRIAMENSVASEIASELLEQIRT